MSDERLRELERRWKETGAVDHEVAYLLERVRVGQLTPEKLGIAAYCGHEAARRTLEEGSHAATDWPPSTGQEWIKGLEPFGHQPTLRIAIAVIRTDEFLSPSTALGSSLYAYVCEFVSELEGWLLDSSLDTVARIKRALDAGEGPDAQLPADEETQIRRANIFNVLAVLAEAAQQGPTQETRANSQWYAAKAKTCSRLAREALSIVSIVVPEPIRARACVEVSVWALGYLDPVLRRVERRAT